MTHIAPDHDPLTLTRWILSEQQNYPNAKGDLSILLNSIQLACKIISNAASGGGIHNLYGLAGKKNKSGDAVKKLDVFANDCMINCISFSGKVGVMASEELENEIIVDNAEDPRYGVVFDPLDGSSNIDANVSIGTIFGIYRIDNVENNNNDNDNNNNNNNNNNKNKKKILYSSKHLLQRGDKLVCAGYALYGDATILVLTFGDSVNGFTLDSQIGEFILTHRDLKIPNKGTIYSINEGNSLYWDESIKEYIKRCKKTSNNDSVKPYKYRYIGSMVADIHRTLLYGGIFMYPSDKMNPYGKLRLLYELNPVAFIIESAGGLAYSNTERILSIIPKHIHQKCSAFIGSPKNVDELIDLYKKASQ